MVAGKGIHVEYRSPDSFIPKANRDNDYLMDRQAQREKKTYSGVFGFSAQDYSLQESMGSIQDHEAEHLLPTDKAVVMARRMLYEAATKLAQGIEPPALNAADQRVRPASVLLARGESPLEWAKGTLGDGLQRPVFSL